TPAAPTTASPGTTRAAAPTTARTTARTELPARTGGSGPGPPWKAAGPSVVRNGATRLRRDHGYPVDSLLRDPVRVPGTGSPPPPPWKHLPSHIPASTATSVVRRR